jgi:hypothetical protein
VKRLRSPPGVYLRFEREHRTALGGYAANGQAGRLVPALRRSNAAFQVPCDLFPRVEPIACGHAFQSMAENFAAARAFLVHVLPATEGRSGHLVQWPQDFAQFFQLAQHGIKAALKPTLAVIAYIPRDEV